MNEVQTATKAYWMLEHLVVVHLTGEQTDGAYELVEFLMPAGSMTPLHVHEHQSQMTYVLEGEVTFFLPGTSVVCGPGQCFFRPAGVPQTDHVTSDGPARVLDVNAPAGFDDFGFDRFVGAAGRPAEDRVLPSFGAPPDLDALLEAATRYGMKILGPPGTLP